MSAKILLVEDNEGDQFLFYDQLERAGFPEAIVAWASTFKEGVARLAEEQFEVVFLDLGLPDRYGLDGLLQLRASHPSIPVVVLTGLDDVPTATKAIREGAADYLVKGRHDARLLRQVLEGALERGGGEGDRVRRDLLEALSPREREIALLMATGRGAQRCAEDLGISVYTTRNHLKKIYRKLAVTGQGELVAKLHTSAT